MAGGGARDRFIVAQETVNITAAAAVRQAIVIARLNLKFFITLLSTR
jgi:hypothetical protein